MLQLMPGSSMWSIPAKCIIPHVLPIVLRALAFQLSAAVIVLSSQNAPRGAQHLAEATNERSSTSIPQYALTQFTGTNLPCLPSSVFKDSVPICRGSLLQTIKESVGADTAFADRTATVITCCTVMYINETYTRPIDRQ